MGIEPTYPAWKAGVLPLNYTRNVYVLKRTVGVTGFEPATSWSQTRRSSQAEPHPESVFCCPPNSLARRQGILYQHFLKKSTLFLKFFLFFLLKSQTPYKSRDLGLFLQIINRIFRLSCSIYFHNNITGLSSYLPWIGKTSWI